MRRLFLTITLGAILVGCGPHRAPIPPGVVPQQDVVLEEDERYGHEVLSILTERFPLDQDPRTLLRVQNVADRLAKAARSDANPWHVYILKDDSFKNAAATRGNHIFVWTGLLNTVRSDEELAAVLSHEMGHVLARHTRPTPMEEANAAIAGVGRSVAGGIVAGHGYGAVANLAGALAEEAIKAFIVNPEAQRKELEADQIGLFLMADAKYDPTKAVDFWRRVQHDPDFSGMDSLSFLSSHPASEERVRNLEQLIPQALERYKRSSNPNLYRHDTSDWDFPAQPAERREPPLEQLEPQRPRNNDRAYRDGSGQDEVWVVHERDAYVYDEPSRTSKEITHLRPGTQVIVRRGRVIGGPDGSWIEITNPVSGFVRSNTSAPFE